MLAYRVSKGICDCLGCGMDMHMVGYV